LLYLIGPKCLFCKEKKGFPPFSKPSHCPSGDDIGARRGHADVAKNPPGPISDILSWLRHVRSRVRRTDDLKEDP
jgi:hypothetical protein